MPGSSVIREPRRRASHLGTSRSQAEWSAIGYRQMVNNARTRLATLAEQFPSVAGAQIEVGSGSIWRGIVEIASQAKADLIILASHPAGDEGLSSRRECLILSDDAEAGQDRTVLRSIPQDRLAVLVTDLGLGLTGSEVEQCQATYGSNDIAHIRGGADRLLSRG